MKKLLCIFALFFCLCAVGCGEQDFVVGRWQVSQYSYTQGTVENTYTIEQVSQFVEKYVTNQTQPQNAEEQIEMTIAMLHSNTEGLVYDVKWNNTIEVLKDGQLGMTYQWQRVDNVLNLKYEDMEMQWYVDETAQYCYFSNTYGEGTISVYLTKI